MYGPSSHRQFEISPYPSSLLSAWLPSSDSNSCWSAFFADVQEQARSRSALPDWNPVVQKLYHYLTTESTDPGAKHFFKQACDQNETLRRSEDVPDLVKKYPIANAEDFAKFLNVQLTQWPKFYEGKLVGLPFSALVSGIDATLSGSKLFSLPLFNDRMRDILEEWFRYLATEESADGFRKEGEQWLSEEAKKTYNFPLWAKDNEDLPYWNSWNSFFVRKFKDPATARPIASPDSNQIVNSPNDGTLFRWDRDIKKDDLFWFKDMNYSLRHILSSSDPKQQDLIDKYKLVEMFEGGYILQTYLNPYNYHRWWVPVNGKVLFDPFVISGLFFSKLMLPDFEGATFASLPYLCQVNARGIVVFQTDDYGYVCCIPLGMSEVSTVEFDSKIKANARVYKGQELGMFNYGGSSFAILFQKLKGKELVFHNGRGPLPQRPILPSSSATSGSPTTVNAGSQIGVWCLCN